MKHITINLKKLLKRKLNKKEIKKNKKLNLKKQWIRLLFIIELWYQHHINPKSSLNLKTICHFKDMKNQINHLQLHKKNFSKKLTCLLKWSDFDIQVFGKLMKRLKNMKNLMIQKHWNWFMNTMPSKLTHMIEWLTTSLKSTKMALLIPQELLVKQKENVELQEKQLLN